MFFAVSWYACHPKIHNPCQGAQCIQRRIVGNDVAVPLRQKALQRMVPTVAAMRRWKLEVGGEDVWFPGSQRKVHRGMGNKQTKGACWLCIIIYQFRFKDIPWCTGISRYIYIIFDANPKDGHVSKLWRPFFFSSIQDPQETQWENQSWSQPEETNR